MNGLTQDEMERSSSNPPYLQNYNEIVEKHFGDVPPDSVYDFLHDILDFSKNLESMECEQDKKCTNKDSCSKCNFMRDSINIIDKHVQDLHHFVGYLSMKLYQLKREIEANQYVFFEDEPVNIVIDHTQNLYDIIKNLKEFVMICKEKKKYWKGINK